MYLRLNVKYPLFLSDRHDRLIAAYHDFGNTTKNNKHKTFMCNMHIRMMALEHSCIVGSGRHDMRDQGIPDVNVELLIRNMNIHMMLHQNTYSNILYIT
jgi:hypothetical protein